MTSTYSVSSLKPPPWQPPQSSPTRACYLWQRHSSLTLAYFVVLPEPSALLTVDPALYPAGKQLFPRADKTCHFNGFLLFLTAKWRRNTSNRKSTAGKRMMQVLNFTRGYFLVNMFFMPLYFLWKCSLGWHYFRCYFMLQWRPTHFFFFFLHF